MPKSQKTRNGQSQRNNSKDSPTEWIPPSSGCTSRWTGFLMAKERDQSIGRRAAKCTYCDVVMDGKPHDLQKHMIILCKSIPGDKKSAYINTVTPNAHSTLESETVDDDSTPASTSSKPNVYAVLALRGTKVKHFIDTLNLHQIRHTSENICTSLYNTLKLSAIKWEQIVAVVTDNPSPMIKLRRLIHEDHPHVIGVPCCLHFFNLIAKDLINHPAMKQPVINALGRLESAKTTLGDIWKELITVYCETSKIDLSTWPGYTDYKDLCLTVLNTRSRLYYNDPVFILALFLTPSCRHLTVSRTYPIRMIQKAIVTLSYFWGSSQAEGINTAEQARLYLDGKGHFGTSKKFSLALDYWLDLPTTLQTNLLKGLAIKLLEIVPHAAGVESLFSAMSATKTKDRASMTLANLTMISQVQLSEANKRKDDQADRTKFNRSKDFNNQSNNEIEVVEVSPLENTPLFSGPDELDEFEQGVDRSQEEATVVDPALHMAFDDGFISSSCDLTLFQPQDFEQVQSDGLAAPVIGAPGAWNPEDINFD
ncbi:hypothetical protein DFH28DRAFT_1182261 [Melampsora americana]|nr:hypothetical protein DFH28DRAFT_1182261 [Melampsora americana]